MRSNIDQPPSDTNGLGLVAIPGRQPRRLADCSIDDLKALEQHCRPESLPAEPFPP